jgi:exopolysaccharide production protein ExoZ
LTSTLSVEATRDRSNEAASRGARLDSIQLLRAAAAIGVVFTHAITRIGVTFPQGDGASVFAGPRGQLTVGDAGVDLFFVISGLIMLHVHQNDFTRSGAPLRFMARRVLRIVPIYWLLTAVAVLFLIFAPGLFTTHYKSIDIPWIVGSFFFLPIAPPGGTMNPVVGVGWTLNYEMFFYGVFAIALFLPRRRGLQLIFLSLGALVVAGTVVPSSGPVFGFLTNWLLLDFLSGLAIAAWNLSERKLPVLIVLAAMLIGIGGLAVTIFVPPPEEGPLRFVGWGIPAALVVFAMRNVVISDGAFARFATVLGDASYSIYLFQFFTLPAWARIMRFAGAQAVPFDLNVILLTVLVTATGFAGWLLVERPVGRLARSWLGK